MTVQKELHKLPTWKEIKRIQVQFCEAASEGEYGVVEQRHVNSLLPEVRYQERVEILTVCDLPHEQFQTDVTETQYFKEHAARRGEVKALESCEKYRKLLGSIREKFRDDRRHAPILLNRGTGTRLDGTHRVSVLRYLGYEEIPCILVEQEEYAEFLLSNISRDIVKNDMVSLGKWYQAIEVIPGLWTRNVRPEKENLMMDVISDWARDRFVFELGANNGLYSLHAALNGTRRAKGYEMSRDYFKKSMFIRMLWNITLPNAFNATFSHADARADLSWMKDSDTLVAGCVIYHLQDGMHEFMQNISDSKIDRCIIQANNERLAKLPPIEDDALNMDSEARMFVTLPRLKKLFSWYGFKEVLYENTDSEFPIAVLSRNLND